MCHYHATGWRDNDAINGMINELDANVLSWLRDDPYLTVPELAKKKRKITKNDNQSADVVKGKAFD